MIKKAILPVAGLGTRFLPATKAQPKEMLAIVDKPVIQYLVEEAVASGITEIIFVTGRGKRAIEDHFDYSAGLEEVLLKAGKADIYKEVRRISNLAKFTYVRQKEPRGDGDALLCAAHLVDGEPVAVLYGDDIIDAKVPALAQMMKVHEKYKGPVVALERVPRSEISKYGAVKATEIEKRIFEIKNLVEKPTIKKAPSNLAVVGKYIITPEVFKELRELTPVRGEIRLADALKNLLRNRSVYGYEFSGKRYDCGSKIGFLKAVVDFGLKHEEVGHDFKKYLKSVIHN